MIEIQNCNITLMVNSMDNAVAFYTEILGLKLNARYGDHLADLEGPGIHIGLHPASKNLHRGDNISIGLRVNDIQTAITALQKAGVACTFHDDQQVQLAYFSDPDGNPLYLAESRW